VIRFGKRSVVQHTPATRAQGESAMTSLMVANTVNERRTVAGSFACISRVALMLVVALGVFVTPARAQFGMMGGGQGQTMDPITKRSFDAFVKLLGFDADQQDTAKALYDGHTEANRALQKEMMEKMAALGERAREDGDFSVFQKDMPAITKDMTAKGEALEKSFFDDLKAVCTETQLAQWPAVERHHRRGKAMRFGIVSGSAVDLVSVLDRIKAAPTDAGVVKDALDAWELEIDRLLVVFEKDAKDAQNDMMEGGAMFDMNKVQTMMKKFSESAAQVRDLNRSYARRIEPALSDEDRAKFVAEVQRRSFPRIYRPSHPQQMIDAAMGFADLTADQKEQLQAVKESYGRDAAGVNERWAKATEEKETEAGGSIMVMMQGFQGMGGDPNDPVKVARDSRRELDSKTKERIESILTAEQKAKLPKKKSEGFNPMGDFMIDEDEGNQ
jgi:Spy/CpxP family protein refolding chaperone